MYRINASIRNAKGREIAHRTPLWSGPAGDPKHAIGMSHDALAPIVKAMAEADTIVLHVSGPKGLRLTTTEYAEDFRIGYGASAVGGTGLLADQIDTGLTAEQIAQAMDALRARAIQAIPGLDLGTLETDAAKKFATGGVVPLGELDRILKEFGTEVEDGQIAGKKFRDAMRDLETPPDDLRARNRARTTSSTATIRDRINLAIKDLVRAGKEPTYMHLSREAHDQFAAEENVVNGDKLLYVNDCRVIIHDDPNLPPIQFGCKPRDCGPGKMYSKHPDGSTKYIGTVQEFTMEVQ